MVYELPYGSDASLALDLPPGILVAACGELGRESLDDPAAAVAAALSAPLGFPPLAQAFVPGDRVTLAVQPGVPQADVVVAAVVRYLMEGQIAAHDVTVLWMPSDPESGADDPCRQLPGSLRQQVRLETHGPAERRQHGLLATSSAGHAIYLHRSLLDADVVVQIGTLHCEPAWEWQGPHGAVFPTFSNVQTLERFRKPGPADGREKREAQARQEIAEVGWLLGAQFVVQVLPGSGDGVLAILAGDAGRVFEEGLDQCRAAWSCTVPRRASLVVAAVSGPGSQQTWDHIGCALAAAERAAAEGGAIALCTDLSVEPGPGLRRLAQTDDVKAALRWMRRECPPDVQVATQVAETLARARVYLLSRLDESCVEDLGIVPVSGASEIARLAKRHDTCIVLANAQHSVPTVGGD